MSRGKRITDAEREQIIALYLAGESLAGICNITDRPKSTVSELLKKYREERGENEVNEQIEQARTQKTIEHIEGTKQILNDLLGIIRTKIELIASSRETLATTKLTELTTSFGTLYDKLERMLAINGGDDEDAGVIEIAEPIELVPPGDDDNE